MKRAVFIAACFAFLLAMTGCGSDRRDVVLSSGTYYAVGDYEELLTPYLILNTDDQSFMLGAGAVFSYAEMGSFTTKENKVIAVSQDTTFTFEIKDSKTLVLIGSGDNDYFKLPEKTEFVLSGDQC